eukprot:12917646-Alexandrium_andersonii.AAC.1
MRSPGRSSATESTAEQTCGRPKGCGILPPSYIAGDLNIQLSQPRACAGEEGALGERAQAWFDRRGAVVVGGHLPSRLGNEGTTAVD